MRERRRNPANTAPARFGPLTAGVCQIIPTVQKEFRPLTTFA